MLPLNIHFTLKLELHKICREIVDKCMAGLTNFNSSIRLLYIFNPKLYCLCLLRFKTVAFKIPIIDR